MKKLLIVIDMQNDFIDGPLGTPEAQAIVPKVVEKINNWNGDCAFTIDSHDEATYYKTDEGQHLPIIHCVKDSEGGYLDTEVASAIKSGRKFEKNEFGCLSLASFAGRYPRVEIIGLCTDICVLVNAILIKTYNADTEVIVDSSCCAGTTPELHEAALAVMRSCHIEVR